MIPLVKTSWKSFKWLAVLRYYGESDCQIGVQREFERSFDF